MVKTGYVEIKKGEGKGKRKFCASCGQEAEKRVTFEDCFCKLKVNLCALCAIKDYDELKLQGKWPFPG